MQFCLPQGSVVGPVAYTVYTLPVGDIANYHNVSHHVYADDLDSAISRLQNCILDIKNWMSVNKMKLKDSKTEFFSAASAHHHKLLPPNIILKIGNEHIKSSLVTPFYVYYSLAASVKLGSTSCIYS